jgi:hypothetical protein
VSVAEGEPGRLRESETFGLEADRDHRVFRGDRGDQDEGVERTGRYHQVMRTDLERAACRSDLFGGLDLRLGWASEKVGAAYTAEQVTIA